jgi:hypothetical protein
VEHEGSQAAAPHAAAAALPGEYVNAVEIRGPLPLVINSVSALSKKNLSHRKPSLRPVWNFTAGGVLGSYVFEATAAAAARQYRATAADAADAADAAAGEILESVRRQYGSPRPFSRDRERRNLIRECPPWSTLIWVLWSRAGWLSRL